MKPTCGNNSPPCHSTLATTRRGRPRLPASYGRYGTFPCRNIASSQSDRLKNEEEVVANTAKVAVVGGPFWFSSVTRSSVSNRLKVGATSVNPSAPSSSRQANNPASEVLPWLRGTPASASCQIAASVPPESFHPLGSSSEPRLLNLDRQAFEAILLTDPSARQFDMGNAGLIFYPPQDWYSAPIGQEYLFTFSPRANTSLMEQPMVLFAGIHRRMRTA